MTTNVCSMPSPTLRHHMLLTAMTILSVPLLHVQSCSVENRQEIAVPGLLPQSFLMRSGSPLTGWPPTGQLVQRSFTSSGAYV